MVPRPTAPVTFIHLTVTPSDDGSETTIMEWRKEEIMPAAEDAFSSPRTSQESPHRSPNHGKRAQSPIIDENSPENLATEVDGSEQSPPVKRRLDKETPMPLPKSKHFLKAKAAGSHTATEDKGS